MLKSPSGVFLIRGEDRIDVPHGMWAELLLFLGKRGRQPSFPAYYLLGNWEVPETDARQLAAIGQKALDDALHDPLNFYPVPFDMGKLAELVDFCQEGGFKVAN